ncbi:MAG: glucoamylase family protein, partial [Eubacteriales bacterium]
RGKIVDFNKFLSNEQKDTFTTIAGNTSLLSNIRYVITVDADTVLPRKSAVKLIGGIAHPLQQAKFNNAGTRIVSGYGILQPRISILPSKANATYFSKLFTGKPGVDPYTCAISDTYQDLFNEGIFTGKGIYDLKIFHKMTGNVFPENKILSHDLIEGVLARTGLVTDIELFDGYPAKYHSYTKRLHRWIRGDWQIIKYVFSKNMTFVSRWKIADNIRRSLEIPAQFVVLFMAFTLFYPVLPIIISFMLINMFWPLLINLGEGIFSKGFTLRILNQELKQGIGQIAFSIVVIPYQTYLQLDAIFRSVVRQTITRRNLLEWETAAETEKRLRTNIDSFYINMSTGLLLSAIFIIGYLYVDFMGTVLLSVLLLAWLMSPFIAYKLSCIPKVDNEISPKDENSLRIWSRQIWTFFDVYVNKENNYLPPDNVQIEPNKGVAHRTSPTNIGLALLVNLAARDFGLLTITELHNKINNTMLTLAKLKRWNGHLLNWYDTLTLEPLYPAYVSTVDNGNYAGYLITLKHGLIDILNKPVINANNITGFQDTLELVFKTNLNKNVDNLTFLKQELLNTKDRQLNVYFLYEDLQKWIAIFKDNTTKEIDNDFLELNHFDFWLGKLLNMFKMYSIEIEQFYPWVKLPKEVIARQFTDEEILYISKLSIKELSGFYNLLLKNKTLLSEEFLSDIKIGKENVVFMLKKSKFIQKELESEAMGMDFKLLFDKKKSLFRIGYNVSEQKLDKSYYDLFASESRQASLFAIAKGDVPEAHWFKLARPLTRIDGNRCLVSWSGTMFEFFMPLLLIKNYTGTLLDETYNSIVKIQKNYTKKYKIPWGISESGFYAFDTQNNYQYKAFGVPGLGLKRGLTKDMVISPYSSFMTLTIDYNNSIENLRMMKKGFNGIFGLYEAIDYTLARVPFKEKFGIVKSYMAHHHGMSLIALNNVLFNNLMQKRFHSEPIIKSVELLLQEQIPLKEYTINPQIIEAETKKIVSNYSRRTDENPAVYTELNTLLPRTSYLSNRDYSVMLTLSGSGYSKFNDIYISRWREDATVESFGTYLYLQNLNSGNVWSATYKPCSTKGDDYKVTCYPNMTNYYRKDGNIVTQTEIFISPENPVEIRKVSLTNLSQYYRDIELTSYFEVVLDNLLADSSHQAFSKLFIKTDYVNNTLLAYRRPRQSRKIEYYLMHTVAVDGEQLGDIEYETDRTRFIGRNRTLSNPKALDVNQPLSNSKGAVLDPIMSLRVRVKLKPGKITNIYFITGIGASREESINLAEKYRSFYHINQVRKLAWSQNLMELNNLDITFKEANMIASFASHILFPGPSRKRICIKNNQKGQSSLWTLGISGDLPIVILRIQDINNLKQIDQILKVHEYLKLKGLYFDLIILNEDKSGYFQSIQEIINQKIGMSHVRMLVNKPGGVFVIKRNQISREINTLLFAVARIVFSAHKGSLDNQIAKIVNLTEKIVPEIANSEYSIKTIDDTSHLIIKRLAGYNLDFYNGYGGFTQDGKEYIIGIDRNSSTPLPWVNVIANPHFGFVVSETGSSYT